MSRLNLTPEERALVQSVAHDRHGPGSRLGFYGSVLVPLLLFGGYGIAVHDFVAVALALVGVVIFVVWRISREVSAVGLYKSLFAKIAEHERRDNT